MYFLKLTSLSINILYFIPSKKHSPPLDKILKIWYTFNVMKTIIKYLKFSFFLLFFILTPSLFSDPSWEIQTVDYLGYTGMGSSLEIDSSGYPCISYPRALGYQIRYARYNGTNWNIQVVEESAYSDTGYDCVSTSLSLDSSGFPHISYNGDDEYFVFYSYKLKYAHYNGSGWEIEVVDSNEGVGMHSSLKLDSSNNPCISYYDYTNADLKYAHYNGEGWEIEVVDSDGDVGEFTSLEIDLSGNPCISYDDNTNVNLKYAHYNGSGWEIEVVDSGNVGGRNSLEFDSSGNPCISYYDSINGDLKYAHYNGSGWEIQTVDSSGDVGMYTSLRLDVNDYPHIAYYDNTNQSLKIAIYNGIGWEYQFVDSGLGSASLSDFYFFSDENITYDGNYHYISYFDNDERDLKYAKGTPEPSSFLIFLSFLLFILHLFKKFLKI